MVSRKELKKRARGTLRRHYWFLVILCLVASFVGLEYTGELGGLGLRSLNGGEARVTENGTTSAPGAGGVWYLLAGGDEFAGNLLDLENLGISKSEDEVRIGNISLGRTRGVLASAVNLVSSGSVLVRIYVAIRNVVGADSVAAGLFVALTLLAYLAVIGGVVSTFYVIFRRLVLEARIYEKVPLRRAIFLLRMGKWLQTARTILLTGLFLALWALTGVGWMVKYFSYRMVPYIVAENPAIGSREAVTLSRRMMNGHKWECFKLECTFLLWQVLSFATLGLLAIFFTNPYHAATMAEYYAALRQETREKKLEGYELLWDDFLYEKAGPDVLRAAYRDLGKPADLPKTGFLTDTFGLVLWETGEERAYETAVEQNAKYERGKLTLEGRAYPERLSPVLGRESLIPEGIRRAARVTELHPMRHYSQTSLGVMFFLFSMVGWVWEVALHLIETGELVNRGFMHGPWLPIYGAGTVLILTVLYRFRGRPWQEFLLTVVLCGLVEYYTALILEVTHGGTRWWDYSGYFLNIHGRVCAEGLLAFGIGGLAGVYFLCPLVDNTLRRLPVKRLISLTAVLLCLFVLDGAYSAKHPNTGTGITDIAAAPPAQLISPSSAARSFSRAFFSMREI